MLDLPMNEAKVVDSLDSENTLCNVETGDIFRECVVLDQHRHEIASRQELHDEVEVGGVLERVVQLHNPRGVGLGQNIAFRADVRELAQCDEGDGGTGVPINTYLVLFQHLVLPESLHGVDLSSVNLLHHANLEVCGPLSIREHRACSVWQHTSPNAPFPITFTVLKSSRPSFVRRSRKNADSRLPSCCSWRCLRSSDIVVSAASFLSSSTRLRSVNHNAHIHSQYPRAPLVALDGRLYRHLVVVL